MGKDSLIKSTAKMSDKKEEKTKKTVAKKKTTKKVAPKKSAKTVAKAKKTTAKKKSTTKATPKKKMTAAKPKTKTTATPKKAAKPKTTAKPKKTAKPKTKTAAKSKPKTTAKKPTKRLTTKALLLKSFAPISKIEKPKPAIQPKPSWPSAPPFVDASDPKERARISKLLFQSYSMSDIKAAANSPIDDRPAPSTTKVNSPDPVQAAQPPSDNIIITDLPPDSHPDPVSKTVKLLAAGVGVVILLLLITSYTNSSKYYIEPKDNAIEIWKGRFSPKDKEYYMVLHGTQLLGESKAVYSREEVYPMIFDYFLGKADTLLEVPGLPDFEGIKGYLQDAEKYAISEDKHKSIAIRLSNIDRMILLYKADVSISKGTLESLEAAVKHLQSAQLRITNATQREEIQQKLNLANSLMAALKAKADKKTK